MAGKILITGATGTVGSELVRALATRGADVRAAVRSPKKAQAQDLRAEIVEVDYDHPQTLPYAFAGVDKLFLLLPPTHDQVELARRLIDAAKAARVKHVVKLGAMHIGPDILFNRWHREAEAYLEASGLPWTILGPTSFMQNFIVYDGGTIASDGKIFQPLGEGRVAYIDARDIAAVAAEILTGDTASHAGKTYDLTGPAAITVGEVAQAIGRAIGREVEYVDIPEEATRQGLVAYGTPPWMADAIMELHNASKENHASTVTDWVERLTGQKPNDIDSFARAHAPAWRH
jgi:uncharacterized protein YbjT (DUF2867 family)